MPDPTQTSDLLQPAGSTCKRRDANGTTACTTNADHGQATNRELDAKTKTVAAG